MILETEDHEGMFDSMTGERDHLTYARVSCERIRWWKIWQFHDRASQDENGDWPWLV